MSRWTPQQILFWWFAGSSLEYQGFDTCPWRKSSDLGRDRLDIHGSPSTPDCSVTQNEPNLQMGDPTGTINPKYLMVIFPAKTSGDFHWFGMPNGMCIATYWLLTIVCQFIHRGTYYYHGYTWPRLSDSVQCTVLGERETNEGHRSLVGRPNWWNLIGGLTGPQRGISYSSLTDCGCIWCYSSQLFGGYSPNTVVVDWS